MILGDVVERNGLLYPSQEAVVDEKRRMTFAELADRTSGLANVLVERGMRRGDRVAVLSAEPPRVGGGFRRQRDVRFHHRSAQCPADPAGTCRGAGRLHAVRADLRSLRSRLPSNNCARVCQPRCMSRSAEGPPGPTTTSRFSPARSAKRPATARRARRHRVYHLHQRERPASRRASCTDTAARSMPRSDVHRRQHRADRPDADPQSDVRCRRQVDADDVPFSRLHDFSPARVRPGRGPGSHRAGTDHRRACCPRP